MFVRLFILFKINGSNASGRACEQVNETKFVLSHLMRVQQKQQQQEQEQLWQQQQSAITRKCVSFIRIRANDTRFQLECHLSTDRIYIFSLFISYCAFCCYDTNLLKTNQVNARLHTHIHTLAHKLGKLVSSHKIDTETAWNHSFDLFVFLLINRN